MESYVAKRPVRIETLDAHRDFEPDRWEEVGIFLFTVTVVADVLGGSSFT